MTLKRAIITSLCIFAFFGCGDENNQKKEQNTSEQTQGKILDKNASKDENLSKDSLTPKMSENAQENEIKEINLKLLNGTTMQITKRSNGFDVKDGKKATLYVFFATWCPPCKAEIPHLNNLSEKFKNELDIVGVLLEDKSEDEVKDFAQKYKIKYEVAVGEGNFLFEKAMGGIKGLPASALFKANGDYVQGYIGLVPEEMLENDINRATK
ncbi:TlpA family protein disulfide reductase [Campylobacter concisus]|uniref:TlpA family protein disulfide reductase n=1 Tax=Campylobacter concisus TaxID=199 RepID=UPI0009FEB1FB|nr:TlpA disulfide reductase family protein [Campylobacter concisus]ORI00110.1 thioredoxin [Campylobacter concisus]